jgi:hypothetical protein
MSYWSEERKVCSLYYSDIILADYKYGCCKFSGRSSKILELVSKKGLKVKVAVVLGAI